ncbi:hypothetical protein MVEN_01046800 [Mycena venus]|uniref:Uncharacterized protein n=1 Tax=Mycena venus TaxID=2733690 RepID=A0A8H7CZ83_9AGAR|nr:hypothetical protein MVEN_01046800 [Mycena venus]
MPNTRLAYSSPSQWTHQLNVTKRLASGMGAWAFGIGSGVFLLLSVTPLVRREVLVKVPLLKSYYEDKTPASDKPF